LPLTQIQLANAVADRADISRAEAKRVFAAFEEVVLEELGNALEVRIGGLVKLDADEWDGGGRGAVVQAGSDAPGGGRFELAPVIRMLA
jgi:hypothetical protein